MEFEVEGPLKKVLKQIRYVILYQNKDWQIDSNELCSIKVQKSTLDYLRDSLLLVFLRFSIMPNCFQVV